MDDQKQNKPEGVTLPSSWVARHYAEADWPVIKSDGIELDCAGATREQAEAIAKILTDGTQDVRERIAREVSGLDCAHGCGVGAEIADKIRALPVLAKNPIKDITEHLCELFGKAQEIFRDRIRQRLLEHGFTIKEGHTDLKPYVYDAVYAVLGDVVLPIIDKLQAAENQLETERMRLAGCGVAALMNTPDSIKDRIGRDSPYWSASYGDVCSMVDREIALREQNAQILAQLSRLQNTVKFCERAAVHHAKTLPASDIVGMIANYPEIADITRQYGEECAEPEFQTEILQKYAQLQQEARAIEANYEATRALLVRYLDIMTNAGGLPDTTEDLNALVDLAADVVASLGSAS